MSGEPDLSPAQELRWRILAVGTTLGIVIPAAGGVLDPQIDFSDPVVAIFFVAVVLGIAYFERRWIKSSTDETGKLRR